MCFYFSQINIWACNTVSYDVWFRLQETAELFLKWCLLILNIHWHCLGVPVALQQYLIVSLKNSTLPIGIHIVSISSHGLWWTG